MAPEQARGNGATPLSDLFAVGLLMAEAIGGRSVFGEAPPVAIAAMLLSDDPIVLSPEVLKSPLGPVIHRATQKAPERRHPSAREMLAHIEAAMTETTRRAHPAASVTAATEPAAYLGPTPLTEVPSVPLVPPAPARGRPKARGVPWMVLAAVGVLAGAAALGLHLGRTSSRSDGGSVVASSSDFVWFLGAHQEAIETAINADGVPDFVTLCHGNEPQLCGIDGAKFRVLWRKPVLTRSGGAYDAYLEVVDGIATFIDASATVRFFDTRTGAEMGALRLPNRPRRTCALRPPRRTLWVHMEDWRSVDIDLATRSIVARSEGEVHTLPLECKYQGGHGKSRYFDSISAGYRPNRIIVDGSDGAATGKEDARGSIPLCVGFDSTAGTLRWKRPIPPDNGFGGTGHEWLDVAGGRIAVTYRDLSGDDHVVVLDAVTGRTLWDQKLGQSLLGLWISRTRVYVAGVKRFAVYEAPSGRLLGGSASSRM
jgi:hypothetical protein